MKRALRGAIPRIEHQEKHQTFLEAAKPPFVMVSIVGANRILKSGETAATYFPDDTDVIVTSTVSDEQLSRLSWEEDQRRGEHEILAEFSPAYCIPADYPVYGSDPPAERVENARKNAIGTIWMAEQLADCGCETTVIPLIKGTTSTEREYNYWAAEQLDSDLAAVYAGQNFSAGGGGGIGRVVDVLESIETESNLEILVIGLLSPQYLGRLPDNVRGVAGLHVMRELIDPPHQTQAAMKGICRDFSAEVAGILDVQPAHARERDSGNNTTTEQPASE